MYTATAIFITILNIINREIIVFIMTKIQFHHRSELVMAQMINVFYALFFNSGLILLFTSADFQYSFMKWVPWKG